MCHYLSGGYISCILTLQAAPDSKMDWVTKVHLEYILWNSECLAYPYEVPTVRVLCGSGDKAVKNADRVLSENLNLRMWSIALLLSVLHPSPSIPSLCQVTLSSSHPGWVYFPFHWLWGWPCDLLWASGMWADAANWGLTGWSSVCHGGEERFLGVTAAPSPAWENVSLLLKGTEFRSCMAFLWP